MSTEGTLKAAIAGTETTDPLHARLKALELRVYELECEMLEIKENK